MNPDILGVPGKGFHTHFLGIAIWDVLGTVIICYGIARYFRISFTMTLVVALVLAEILHYIFGVKTAVLRFIGL